MTPNQIEKDREIRRVYNEITAARKPDSALGTFSDEVRAFYSAEGHAVRWAEAEARVAAGNTGQLSKSTPTERTDHMSNQRAESPAQFDTRIRQAWDNDPALRAEFCDSLEAYVAYEKAAAAGNIKILSGNVVRRA